MSLKMAGDIERLEARVKSLEAALAAKASPTVHEAEHATKEDIDAFLARIRVLEGKIEAMGRKKP